MSLLQSTCHLRCSPATTLQSEPFTSHGQGYFPHAGYLELREGYFPHHEPCGLITLERWSNAQACACSSSLSCWSLLNSVQHTGCIYRMHLDYQPLQALTFASTTVVIKGMHNARTTQCSSGQHDALKKCMLLRLFFVPAYDAWNATGEMGNRHVGEQH